MSIVNLRKMTAKSTFRVMKKELQFNIEPLLWRLQSENKRRYTYTEVANRIGVKRQSIERLSRNDSFQDLLVLLSALLDFFAAEGMPITIDQLFTVQEEGSQAENLDSQPL